MRHSARTRKLSASINHGDVAKEEAEMAAKRISMRKIKEILRLDAAGLSGRKIALALGVSRSVVSATLQRASMAKLSWPTDLDERALDNLLYGKVPPSTKRALPDWSEVHRELRRKGVTLSLLWQEYKTNNPDGYQYSWFCERYRMWRRKLDVVMRQDHKAGEKLFVDYAGHTVTVVDHGQQRQAQIFVVVLGASNYSYAEATWSQSLKDWIASHERAFAYLGGVPEIVVPDNLKSGVSKAHRYEPDLNPTYQDMAMHYDVAVIPARAAKPRDKAKVETGVQIVERWILARLRNRKFFSLDELNEAIAHLLEQLNEQPFQKIDGSRKSLFESLEAPVLRPLPTTRYDYAEWKKARVNIDYHIDVEGHYYSVPYQLVRQQIDVRITESAIECFLKGKRVASHKRSLRKGRHSTVKEHMPQSHRHYADWTPDRIVDWAAKTGEATKALVEKVIASRAHPQQGYRTCLGILRLGDAHGKERLEAAAIRALAIGATSYRSLASILKKGLDKQPLPASDNEAMPTRHANIRGADYYRDYANSPNTRQDRTTTFYRNGQSIAPANGRSGG